MNVIPAGRGCLAGIVYRIPLSQHPLDVTSTRQLHRADVVHTFAVALPQVIVGAVTADASLLIAVT